MDEMILDLIDYGVEDEYDEDEEEGYVCLEYGYSNIVKGVQVD